ncbi:collagen alpha-1(III) chain-like [Pantherophis guttatus]|uniref:Collagen alpha-1(III) chain-like n=1 Tax=Pantherophis guttatus TaxID=94885 RepID=A0A6P9B1J3_PANGU|nr:collagen alpha-1(III) chain-like [Pantherophis guttatus]
MGGHILGHLGQGDCQGGPLPRISLHTPDPISQMPFLSGSGSSAPDGIGHSTSSRDSGHRTGTSGAARTRLLLPPVRHPEVVGGLEGNSRPQIPEPTDPIPSVQNAVPQLHLGGYQARGPSVLNRSDGGLPPRSSPHGLQAVPPLLLCGSSLSISSPPIRPILGPPSFYKNHGRASGLPPDSSSKDPGLSGRSPRPVDFGGSSAPGLGHHPPGPGEPRVFRQHGQEPFDTHDSHTAPGSHHRFGGRQGLSFPGPPVQPAVTGQVSVVRETSLPGSPVQAPGKDGLLHRDHPLGASPLQGSAVVSDPVPKTSSRDFRPQGPPSPQSSPLPPVVVFSSSPQGEGVQGVPIPYSDYRCQSPGLGGPPVLVHGPGVLVPVRSDTQYKLVGTSGHPPGPSDLPGSGVRQTRIGTDGQCSRQGSCKPPGGDPVSPPHAGGRESGSLGGVSPEVPPGISHIGRDEHPGGLAQPGVSGPRGVGPRPGPVSDDHRPPGPPGGGSVRHSGQSPDREILLSLPGAGGGGSGRNTQQLAGRPPLCLSASASHSQSHQKDAVPPGGAPVDCPVLAPSAMVRGPPSPVRPSSLASSSRQSDSSSRAVTAPGSGVASANRLAVERSLLKKSKIPSRVANTIQAARRPSTTRIYDSTWRSFVSWCNHRSIVPTSASTVQVLVFLQDGFEAGLAPNTLRRQVSALSTILCCGSRHSLSSRSLIRLFLRGASNLRPGSIHRYPSWDLPLVLDALTKAPFEPLRSVGLRFLSYKVAFLLAITSARRISELAALSIRADLCVFHPDRVVLRLDPTFLPKVNSPYHRAQELVLPNFCPRPSLPLERAWHSLDVRRALRIYIHRTSDFRRSESLLVSFQPSSMGQKVSSITVGRWIRATIATAYGSQALPVPPRITAHSTRSAATSAAWATQASLEEICRAAAWSSPTPFIRHYRLDQFASADAAFGRRVLQQVLQRTSSSARATPSL